MVLETRPHPVKKSRICSATQRVVYIEKVKWQSIAKSVFVLSARRTFAFANVVFGGGVDGMEGMDDVDHELMERAGVTESRNWVSLFVHRCVLPCARMHSAEGTKNTRKQATPLCRRRLYNTTRSFPVSREKLLHKIGNSYICSLQRQRELKPG